MWLFAMILIDVLNSKVADNNIWQPGNSTFEPMLIGNTGPGPNQRAYGNSITGNRIYDCKEGIGIVSLGTPTWSTIRGRRPGLGTS